MPLAENKNDRRQKISLGYLAKWMESILISALFCKTHKICTPIIRLKTFCRLAWRSQSYYWRTMAIIEEELYEKRERRTFILPCYLFSNITSSSADYVLSALMVPCTFQKKATRARVREADVVWWFHISPPFFSVFTNLLTNLFRCVMQKLVFLVHAKTFQQSIFYSLLN